MEILQSNGVDTNAIDTQQQHRTRTTNMTDFVENPNWQIMASVSCIKHSNVALECAAYNVVRVSQRCHANDCIRHKRMGYTISMDLHEFCTKELWDHQISAFTPYGKKSHSRRRNMKEMLCAATIFTLAARTRAPFIGVKRSQQNWKCDEEINYRSASLQLLRN